MAKPIVCSLRSIAPPPSLHTTIDITAHVVLIGAFLSAFYFLYVDQVEGEIVALAVDGVIEQSIDQMNAFRDTDIRKDIKIRQALEKMELPDTSAADAKVKSSNAKVRNKAIIMVSTLVAVGGGLAGLLWWMGKRREKAYHAKLPATAEAAASKYSAREARWVMLSNLQILCAVAITEYLFLILVARNYKSLTAGGVETEVGNEMIAWAKT